MSPGAESDQTRLRLLTAAAEEMLARGFTGASLAHIAQRLGLTKGALSHHFSSKQALIDGVVSYSVAAMPTYLAGARAAFPDSPARACVALIGAMAAASRTQPIVGAAILHFQDPSVDAARVAPLREAMSEALAAVLVAARDDEGYVLKMDVADAVQFLHVILSGFLAAARFPESTPVHQEPLIMAAVLREIGITDADVVVMDVLRTLAG